LSSDPQKALQTEPSPAGPTRTPYPSRATIPTSPGTVEPKGVIAPNNRVPTSRLTIPASPGSNTVK
jgi:hypothetical protein